MKNQKHKSRLFWIMGLFFSSLIFVVMVSCEMEPPENSKAAQAIRGKVHFQKHCSQCHGEDGKGLKIDSLSALPADLTEIQRRNNGKFPIKRIADVIDGRKMVRGHRTRDMPVWGEVFSTQENLDGKELRGRFGELVAYLMTIQGT